MRNSFTSLATRSTFIGVLFCMFLHIESIAQPTMLDDKMHHLRNAEPREWSEFSQQAEASRYVLNFNKRASDGTATLSIRQYDVKQDWTVTLNEHKLGLLHVDEKDMRVYYVVPAELLKNENNTLVIQCESTTPDDVLVGEISLYPDTVDSLLSQSRINFEIVGEDGMAIPGRITIVDDRGVLQSIVGTTGEPLAVRPGYVYTASGKGSIQTKAGTYTLYATRGFEYGVDSMRVTLQRGETWNGKFTLRREVDTKGWVSSDTHLHTFTHSGHGDCTDVERAITIAGEGIEVPIMTDHNKHIDLSPLALQTGTHKYFTPVVGNEVTTRVGHFNIFPVTGSKVVNHDANDWRELWERINTPVIILNHGRDVHHAFRPFDKERYLQSAGWRLDGNEFFANAMEVLNSGSQQSDPMQLFHDWFGLLNRGYSVAPVGSSDSHDVSRFFAGQARTFVRSDDANVSNIDINTFVKNLTEGKVMVSQGLLVKIVVNERYGPGDLVPSTDSLRVVAEVYGPGWSNAETITLFANGRKIRESQIHSGKLAGLKGKFAWTLPRVLYDQNLVVIAEGRTSKNLYWPLAKPYQPASPDWTPKYMSATGAVWVDGDGNGKRNSAFDYATAILKRSRNKIAKTINQLDQYDAAVAAQVAVLLVGQGVELRSREVESALTKMNAEIRNEFAQVREAIK